MVELLFFVAANIGSGACRAGVTVEVGSGAASNTGIAGRRFISQAEIILLPAGTDAVEQGLHIFQCIHKSHIGRIIFHFVQTVAQLNAECGVAGFAHHYFIGGQTALPVYNTVIHLHLQGQAL